MYNLWCIIIIPILKSVNQFMLLTHFRVISTMYVNDFILITSTEVSRITMGFMFEVYTLSILVYNLFTHYW